MKSSSIGLIVLAILFVSLAALVSTADSHATTEPVDLKALITQGKLDADLGNFKAAAEAFSAVAADASASASQRWEALVRLGMAENARGDYRRGAEAFKEVTAAFADDPEAVVFLMRAVAGTAPGKIWVDLEPQFEDLLASAEVVSTGELLMGVSGPKRVHLAQDDIELRALFKSWILRTEHPADRGALEIAAYEVDKILGLDMVPPSVERVIDGETGSLQLWVEGCQVFTEREELRRAAVDVDLEQSRMQTFDSLIGNRGRHLGQILVAPAGDLVLIDHTRTFGTSGEVENPPDRFDRQLVKSLRALDRDELRDRLSHLLSDDEIEAILDRRDALLAHLDQIIAERGQARVLF